MRYPEHFRQCKASAHHWSDYEPAPGEFKKPEIGSRWVQYCPNCSGFRHRLVNRITGAVLDTGWQYRMPEGYKPTKAMTRQDFRRLYFRSAASPAPKRRLQLVKDTA